MSSAPTHTRPTGRRLAEGLLFVVTVVWGSTFIVMKNVTGTVSASGFVFLRFAVATLACGIAFHRHMGGIGRSTLRKGAFIGLFLFLGILMQVWGLRYTSSSNSAFLTGLIVITVPLVESILARTRPRTGTVVGATAAMAGLVLLAGSSGAGILQPPNVGDLLTLVGTAAWTVEVIAIDRLVGKEDPYALSFLQFLTVTILAGAVFALSGDTLPAPEPDLLFAVLYTGLAGTFLAFTAQTVVQVRTTPARAVLIYSFEPVFALLFALVVPGPAGFPETLGWIKASGCLLVFSGMLASEFLPLRPRAPA